MALSDFWELKDFQTFAGKPVLNVYHCKRIEPTATAQDVVEAFRDSILTAQFLAQQQLNIDRQTIECQNLKTVTDFFSLDSSALGGTNVGQFMATFHAATIQFNRTRTDMKNGQKRYAMGVESDNLNGSWEAAFFADLQTIGATLVLPWARSAAPLVEICNFAILKRFCVVPAQDPCVKYRLPNTDAEADGFHYVPTQFLVRANARSQVSRKIL